MLSKEEEEEEDCVKVVLDGGKFSLPSVVRRTYFGKDFGDQYSK